MCELPPQRVRVDEVDELGLSVDLHDGDQLAVARLQLGVAVNLDFFQVECKLVAQRDDGLPGALAEVAAGSGVQPDEDYG